MYLEQKFSLKILLCKKNTEYLIRKILKAFWSP